MSVVIMDGRVRVAWVTAIASIAAPTVAELNAGTLIHDYITPDGLDLPITTNRVPVGNVGSTYNLERIGRRVPSANLTFHHESPTDVPWNLFVYRAVGFLVVRLGVDTATAWTVAQGGGGSTGQVMVLPVECGQDAPVKPAPDTPWDFTTDMAVYLEPNFRAVVA